MANVNRKLRRSATTDWSVCFTSHLEGNAEWSNSNVVMLVGHDISFKLGRWVMLVII